MNLIKFILDNRLWLITTAGFVLLIVFFDRNNFLERARVKAQIRQTEQQRDYYLGQIAADSILIERLKDDSFLEQYAREHYLMSREGERVYVIR